METSKYFMGEKREMKLKRIWIFALLFAALVTVAACSDEEKSVVAIQTKTDKIIVNISITNK